jgi:hypothetical protein
VLESLYGIGAEVEPGEAERGAGPPEKRSQGRDEDERLPDVAVALREVQK